MPRKNTMRDNVNAVRGRLPNLSNFPREKIELALLYYESNVDETVEAFNRNGAVEALNGWTEINNGRGNISSKQTNNKVRHTNSPSQIPPSNGVLRPSQRVSNIFQIFAEGGTPTPTCSSSDNNVNHDSITTTDDVISDQTIEQPKPQRQKSVKSRNNSTTTPKSLPANNKKYSITTTDDVISDQTIEQPKPQRRKSVKSRNNSITIQNYEPTTSKSLPANNKKLLTKSVKDLQRQTSTLTNVELLFDNEIKSSIKRIDDIFKQLREIIKEREIELYLQMDDVKDQGLNVIHRRQQRAFELRQRIDRCDRLEPFEIDNLRTDIKQFVTDRRYELGEELTSLHRFEYDQTLIESLKNFGHVFKIDRRSSIAPSSIPKEKSITDITLEKLEISVPNDIVNSDNDEVFHPTIDDNITGDNPQNFHSLPQTNGYLQYYDQTYSYQNVNRRRAQQYFQQPRPLLNYYNGNNRRNIPKQINGRVNTYNNNETTNTYRRPRPPPRPVQSIVPIES